MRVSAWPRLPGLCHSPVCIPTGLEDCLEALDETADHSRDLVDRAGGGPANLGLALDGRAHEMGSGLKGVVGGYARGKPKITRDCNRSNQWNLCPKYLRLATICA